MGLNAVLITEYDHYADITFTEGEDYAAKVAKIFASFGIERASGSQPLRGRASTTELETAMKAWSYSPAGTVVYWLGHGAGPGTQQSPGRLLHSGSERSDTHDGLLPGPLADRLAKLDGNTKLVVLIIEACRIDAFARAVKEYLREKQQYGCPTLILCSSETATVPGRVLSVLEEVIEDVCGADAEITLAKIGYEFELRRVPQFVANELLHDVGHATLTRSVQLPTGQTLDVHRLLRDVVDRLPPDERLHFVAKAQSAGSGELTWNFEGRDEERRAVRTWINTADESVFIVRGKGGQGKSAFLGDIVTRSRPELYEALVRADLMTEVDSWTDLATPNTVISINASGLTTRRLLDRVLEGLGESADPDVDIERSLERVAARVASMHQLVLLIIDGIDEMQEPIEGARFVGTLSARCEAKVLVACRDTPNEGRQYLSYVHSDLVQAIVDAAPTGKTRTITLEADEGAISRYIKKRLSRRDDELVIPDDTRVGATDFLHARLLVHELLAQPEYLEAGLLDDFLQLDLPQLFDHMIDRLEQLCPAFLPIFQACALSQGHGLPMADDVWLTMARELAGTDETDEWLDRDAVASFLTAAKPYLRIDSEFEQTVYRPAHSLLREHVLSTLGDTASAHRALAKLCATQAGKVNPNAYYRHAATLHARGSLRTGWWDIDRIRPPVWQLLEPSRVVEDAMRDLFGRAKMPSGVEELVLRHRINSQFGGARAVDGWAQAVRLGSYQQGPAGRGPQEGARLHWARDIDRQPLFLSLTGHRGRVTVMEQAHLGPDESGLLVGTSRGAVNLWNLASGGLVAEFEGLQRAVCSIVSVADIEHGLVVAGADTDVISAWAARTRRVLWSEPHSPPVAGRGKPPSPRSEAQATPTVSMIALSLDDVSAAIVVTDHKIRIIDIQTGRDLCAARPSNWRLGPAVAVSDGATGLRAIVVGTADERGFVELNLQTTRRVPKLTVPRFVELPAALISIRVMADTHAGLRLLLAQGQVLQWLPNSPLQVELSARYGSGRLGDVSVSSTGLADVRVIDQRGTLAFRVVDEKQRQTEIAASHVGTPTAVRIIDRPGGRAVVASGGSDRTVRIWDPYSVGDRKSADGGDAQIVLAVGAGGDNILAVVGREGGNGTVQFVDGSNARTIKELKLESPIVSLCSSVDNPGRALIAAGTALGEVHVWKQNALGRPEKVPFISEFTDGVVVDIDASAEFLAAADSAGDVMLWRQSRQLDPVTAMQFPESHVTNVKVVRLYGDLVVIVVVTTTHVHSFSIPLKRAAGQPNARHAPLSSAGVVSCLYTNGRGIGLVSGAVDGQVHILPQLWTRQGGLDTNEKYSPPSLNIRQPITAIQALPGEAGRPTIVVGGAYGALAMSTDPLHQSPRIVDFRQHVSSVSAHGETVLAAVQGGVVSFGYGRE